MRFSNPKDYIFHTDMLDSIKHDKYKLLKLLFISKSTRIKDKLFAILPYSIYMDNFIEFTSENNNFIIENIMDFTITLLKILDDEGKLLLKNILKEINYNDIKIV